MLLTRFIAAATLLGLLFGAVAPGAALALSPVASIFLRLIRSVIAPLLAGVLVTSLAASGGIRGIGLLGFRAIVYFEAATTAALLLGYGVAVLTEPGAGVSLGGTPPAPAEVRFMTIIEESFPASLPDAMARGDVLQIVVFCLLFGAAAGSAGPRARPVVGFCESLARVMFEYTRLVMFAAPVAVFASVAATVAGSGSRAVLGLGRFVAVSIAAQIFFAVVVLGGLLALCRIPLRPFLRAAREPFLIAFTTTSSAAALPRALENMQAFGVPAHVAGLVMPLGVSFNLAGSTLHLALATFFVAQASGRSLSAGEAAMILLTLKLTSKGVAGIPRANFVILGALFASYGLPQEALAALLGVDAFIDMFRTGVNVLGHCVAPAVIARWHQTR